MKPPEQNMDSGTFITNSLDLNLFWDLQSKDTNIRLKAAKELTLTLQKQQKQMVGSAFKKYVCA